MAFCRKTAIFLCLMGVVCSVNASSVITNFDTANDLDDTDAGSTIFGESVVADGVTAQAFDNLTNTYCRGTAGSYPIHFGIRNLSQEYKLTGFSFTSGSTGWRQLDDFTLQGSINTTTGYDGEWDDIFSYDSSGIPQDVQTRRWNSTSAGGDNTFAGGGYTAFRMKCTDGGTDSISPEFREIEFFGTTSFVACVSISVSGLTDTSAVVNATLQVGGSPTTAGVKCYWATSDQGTNHTGWLGTNDLGASVSEGAIAPNITNLTADTDYVFRLYATNSYYNLEYWSAAQSFKTIGQPEVDNGSGATPYVDYATLNGNLTTGTFANVYVYWGASDGDTNKNNWAYTNTVGELAELSSFSTNTVSGLYYGMTYYYRCYATNSVGDDWADSTTNFTTISPNRSYVVKPTGVVLTDTTLDGARPAVNTINGGGFDSSEQTDLETGAYVLDTWPDVDTGTYTLNQRSCRGGWSDDTATFTWTLHGSDQYSVSGIHLWNYIEDTSRGTDTFNIEVSSDSNTWTAVNGGSDYTIARGNSGAVLLGETFNFDQTYDDIQYVRINTTAVNGYPGFDETRLIAEHDPALVSITNMAATNLQSTSAYLNGTLAATGSVFDVYVFWGLDNEGTNQAAWPTNEFVGSFTNYTGDITHQVTGQTPGAYYFTFLASNVVEEMWSTNEMIAGMGVPILNVNAGATNISGTNAYLRATMTATGDAPAYVSCYWGTNDGGRTASAWMYTNHFGLFTDTLPYSYTNNTSVDDPLLYDTVYYYSFLGTNSIGINWSGVSSFRTLAIPEVNNGSGATPAVGSAEFTGNFTTGTTANVYIYWGTTDGVTNKNNWDYEISMGSLSQGAFSTNVTTNLYYGPRYYYRCYVSNAVGESWASATTNFLTQAPGGAGAGMLTWDFEDAGSPDLDGWTVTQQSSGANNVPYIQVSPSAERGLSTVPCLSTAFDLPDGPPGFVGDGAHDLLVCRSPTFYINSDTNNITWKVQGGSDLATAPTLTADAYVSGNQGTALVRASDGVRVQSRNIDAQASELTHSFDVSALADDGLAYYLEAVDYFSGGWGYCDWDEFSVPGSLNAGGGSFVTNKAPTAVSGSSATMNGTYDATGSVFSVYVYWGTTDGGTNAASWANTNYIDTYTNVVSQSVSYTNTSIPSGFYYYRFAAHSDAQDLWATNVQSFIIQGAPTVVNSGATPATDSATLTGDLTAGAVADAWICWATNDAGTSSTGDWANVVSMGSVTQAVTFSTVASSLETNRTYWYRCYATNALGVDWSDSATAFNSTPPGRGGSGYSLQITFTNFAGRGVLTNFPALVKLTTNNTDSYTGFLDTTNGWDLRFWDNAGLSGTELRYEIESFATDTNSFVWVKIPELTNNLSIWASWGDDSYNSQETYTTNGDVWTEGFRAVWHLDDDYNDSSTNANNGWAQNAVDGSGIVAQGEEFDGADDSVEIPHDTSLKPDTYITISAWIKPDTLASMNREIYRKEDGNDRHLFSFQNTGSILSFGLEINNSYAELDASVTASDYTDGNWHLVNAVYDGSFKYVYTDAAEDDKVAASGAIGTAGSIEAYIGAYNNGASEEFDGFIDEVRISDVPRSTNWIWACWMNQGDNHSSFAEYGTPQGPDTIQNLAPTAVTNSSAVFNAALSSAGATNTVWVHWGTEDKGTNDTWASKALLGGWNDVASTNVSYPATLSGATDYYYTFRATNATDGAVWASPSWSFRTPGAGTSTASTFMFW